MTERRKLEAEKEKVEKEERDSRQRQQRLQEKVRQLDSQMDRSRTLLSSFLGVAPAHILKPKPPDTAAPAHCLRTSDTSRHRHRGNLHHRPLIPLRPLRLRPPVPLLPPPTAEALIPPFHPFQPKPNTSHGPTTRPSPCHPMPRVSFMDHNARPPPPPLRLVLIPVPLLPLILPLLPSPLPPLRPPPSPLRPSPPLPLVLSPSALPSLQTPPTPHLLPSPLGRLLPLLDHHHPPLFPPGQGG